MTPSDLTCPWCGKAQMACHSMAGCYQYQCDACDAYGHLARCEEEAAAFAFGVAPGNVGLLLDAEGFLGVLARRYEDEGPRGGGMALLVRRLQDQILAAVEPFREWEHAAFLEIERYTPVDPQHAANQDVASGGRRDW